MKESGGLADEAERGAWPSSAKIRLTDRQLERVESRLGWGNPEWQKARILAVDDQLYFRTFLEGLLSEEGYAVETAAGGAEALHVAGAQTAATWW